jgi:hypothetical protein
MENILEEKLKKEMDKRYPIRPTLDHMEDHIKMFVEENNTINSFKQVAFVEGIKWHIEQLKIQEKVERLFIKAKSK